MTNANRKRLRRGHPLRYKLKQLSNSAIPYAYFCIKEDSFLLYNGNAATQQNMHNFMQKFKKYKGKEMCDEKAAMAARLEMIG